MRNYTLFYKPTCPFCKKVLNYMDEQGIDLPLRDVSTDAEARDELLSVGGKTQVPCLFIDGEPLYESGDIIDYLSKTFG